MKLEELIKDAVLEVMTEEVEKIREYMYNAVKYAVYGAMERIDLEEMVGDLMSEMVSENAVKETVEEMVATFIDNEI